MKLKEKQIYDNLIGIAVSDVIIMKIFVLRICLQWQHCASSSSKYFYRNTHPKLRLLDKLKTFLKN